MAEYETQAEALRSALDQSRMSKTEFAKACEVTYVTANRWTNGHGFSPDNQRKAEKVLGLDVGALAGDDPLAQFEPRDPNVVGSIPSREELLQEDPSRPGWNEALKKLGGVLEDFPDHILWACRDSLGRDGKYRYDSYKDLIMTYKKIQDREEDVEWLRPPADTTLADETRERIAKRTARKRG